WKPLVASVCAVVLAGACAPAVPSVGVMAAAAPVAAVAPAKLNVVVSGLSGAFSGLYTAAEAGYFQDEGLDVTLTQVD
ncbi:ABC transporter substrate-binding protein, partial [Escherichia coli]